MAFQFFRSDKSVRFALRRIAAAQMDGALSDMRDATLPEAELVHSLRRRTKKLRGLLRLVQPVFPDFRHENAALREAARSISGLRDGAVMQATLARVAEDVGLGASGREILTQRLAAATPASPEHDGGLAAFHSAMLAARDRVGDWKLEAKGFDALAPGLAKTMTRAQIAMSEAAAQRAGDFEATPFHEWRKQVKAHWYQARLLLPLWPEVMSPHCAAADALGELLGDHNDLDVLARALHAAGIEEDPALASAARQIRKRILAERTELADRALHLGQRLLAGSASDLTHRWRQWWGIWRSEDD